MDRELSFAHSNVNNLPNSDLLILPIGSIERHGDHLPLGTDTIIAEYVSQRVALKLRNEGYKVFVLPPIWYGYTWSLLHLDGTITIEPSVLKSFIEDILVSLANPRFTRILIINGHGGNKEPIELAVKEALLRLGPGIKIGYISWWDVLDEETLDRALPGSKPLHACEIETSIMLYICPSCVDKEALNRVEPVRPPRRSILRSLEDTRKAFSKGYLGDPKKANEEAGKVIIESVIDKLVDLIKRELTKEKVELEYE
ncbi:hypothetical protein EYM_07480 [Ignicoccus islandicus DSM 13165]|uniref:Creatininase n=1 Tax=Ignicoccus islandicus DSM 13165 TaxID=940295 RepID=A0A0U3EBS7_9CREN|nr:creatininase family protein [Ignicoccus islandicus]ALU12782.1 hypothetical protein EYM_07480 [Ignicoccus islandicus DSM 13165]